MYQQRFSFLAWVALVGIPSMLLDNLEEYIIQFGEIQFVLWTNIFSKWNKYIVAFVSIRFFHPLWMLFVGIPQILLDNLEKIYIVQPGKIYLVISANTFCNLEKYILVNNGSDVRFSFSAWVSLVGIGWMRGGCQN